MSVIKECPGRSKLFVITCLRNPTNVCSKDLTCRRTWHTCPQWPGCRRESLVALAKHCCCWTRPGKEGSQMATNNHHHHHCSIVITISNLLQVNLPSRTLLLRPTEDVQGAIVEVANKNRMFWEARGKAKILTLLAVPEEKRAMQKPSFKASWRVSKKSFLFLRLIKY